jgi:hypothetical protein
MRRFLIAVAALAAWASTLSPLFAFQPPPAPGPQPGMYNPRSAAVQAPPQQTQGSSQAAIASLQSTVPIFNPAYPNPSNGGGGYYPYGGGYTTPTEGYLNGAANVTVANAQYQLTTQQARIVKEQANREMLATRRAAMDARDYETKKWFKENDPDTARIHAAERALRRAMNDPPSVEIWAGDSLNAIYADLRRAEQSGVRGPSVLIDPQILPHINLTTGTTTLQGVGMLKDLTKFDWPQIMRRSDFDDDRKGIEEMTRKAVGQVKTGGQVDVNLLDQLDSAMLGLQGKLESQVQELTPTQYVRANRYVKEIRDSLKIFQDPMVKDYFTNKYEAKGDTIAQLVQNMMGQGLRFAPAAPGDEPSYTILHTLMVTYETRLQQYAGR